MSQQDLGKSRKGKQFVVHAEKKQKFQRVDFRQSGTSHMVVTTDRGSAVVPVHSKDLGKGLRAKLIKAFIAIGLGLFLLNVILPYFLGI